VIFRSAATIKEDTTQEERDAFMEIIRSSLK